MRTYKLHGHDIIPCQDLREWGAWYGTEPTVVAEDTVDGTLVRTIFLGLDISLRTEGPPDVFETMAYSGPRKGEPVRYASWEEAMVGHATFVEGLRS
jgi:hypothetical protein